MSTTLEVSSSAIRLCREQRGTLVALESHPVPAGADPLDVLASAPLPKPLGRTTVILQHPDMLLRTMLQPPCPPERLERIVRFELANARGDDSDPVAITWHLVKGGGAGDMRVLALVTKQALIDRVKKALAPHEGRLGSLIHPAIGLYHAWRRQVGEFNEDTVLLDIGGRQIHLALAQNAELLMVRSQAPGMEQLAKQIAEAQSLPEPEATRLMTRLGKGSPEALHDLIRRQAQQVASLVTNNARFAKAQFQLERFDPKAVWVAGAGAQVHGFVEALKERLGIPVRLLNPFAGVLSSLPAADLDRQAALPSPWTPTLGAALAQELELDAVSEERERASAFWRTQGALRVAAAVAATLLVLALLRQTLAIGSAATAVEQLQGADATGLVPKARKDADELDRLAKAQEAARQRIAFLDGERRPGRVALELLSAIAEQQNPETCPVVLRAYRIARIPGAVQVEIDGIAESAPRKSPADVLRQFERQLVRAYTPIGSMLALPPVITPQHLQFFYKITIPDDAPRIVDRKVVDRLVTLRIAADPLMDPRGVAQVMLDRVLENEDSARITVVSAAEPNKALGEFAWTPRGMTKAK